MADPPQAQIARELARLRASVPGGPNDVAAAAMAALARIGDPETLEAVEAHLAEHSIGVSYGDRDDDPPDWTPDPRMFAALAGWWDRLGLRESRAAWLVAGQLGDDPPRADAARRLYWRVAPHVAGAVAPLLLAALEGASAARRARIAYALGSAPTAAAVGALITLLGDPGPEVRRDAALAIGVGGLQQVIGAPVVALRDPPARPPLLRAGSTDQLPADSLRHCYVAFYMIADRADLLNSLADVARLLSDPAPDVRRRAAGMIRNAGLTLSKLAPDEAERLGAMLAAGPPIDLPALLSERDPALREAALMLAGRMGEANDPQRRAALSIIIADMLSGREHLMAINALERLRARQALPRLRAILSKPQHPAHRRAPLILGRLGDQAAVPGLEELLALNLYVEESRAVLDELRAASGQPAGGPPVRYGHLALTRAELSYLAAYGDGDALARVQRSEEYAFAAACVHRCFDAEQVVATARQIEARVLRAAGLSQAQIADPVEMVRRALSAPLHPDRLLGRFGGPIAQGERKARWQDLCLALAGAEPPAAAIGLAAELLAGWPDELRLAHESWWLEVVRSQGSELVYSRQVIRAAPLPQPGPAFALARAVSIGPELSLALDPGATLAWLARASIPLIMLDPAPMARERWVRAVAAADPTLRQRITGA